MLNRALIGIGVIALFLVILLNVIPFFWTPGTDTYIRQDAVRGMAIKRKDLLYTLNFDQQKRVVDILNRAIPVGDPKSVATDPPLDFQAIVIYRFDQPDITIIPLRWVEKNLLFSAIEWSESHLLEVSHDELFALIPTTFDLIPFASQ